MPELWDIYDENRNLTGETIYREECLRIWDSLPENFYHLAVHIWIRNDKGEWLLSKRTPNKSYPLLWEWTGGSAFSGENSLTAALREVKEELGISLPENSGFLYKSIRRDVCHDFCDIYVFNYRCDINEITFQEDETCDAMWASKEKIYQLIETKQFIPLENSQYAYELINGNFKPY